MTPEQYEVIHRRAISLGADPFKDPVGSHLASKSSAIAILFDFGLLLFIVGISKGKGSAVVLGLIMCVITGIPFFLSAIEVSRYSRTSLMAVTLVAMLTAPFSGIPSIGYLLGLLKR